jgi:hypothetical protein
MGKILTYAAYPLTAVMGCPCCGPRWYANMHRALYRLRGESLPPELQGVANG